MLSTPRTWPIAAIGVVHRALTAFQKAPKLPGPTDAGHPSRRAARIESEPPFQALGRHQVTTYWYARQWFPNPPCKCPSCHQRWQLKNSKECWDIMTFLSAWDAQPVRPGANLHGKWWAPMQTIAKLVNITPKTIGFMMFFFFFC